MSRMKSGSVVAFNEKLVPQADTARAEQAGHPLDAINDANVAQLDTMLDVARRHIVAKQAADAPPGHDESFTSLASMLPGVVYQRVVTPDGQIRYTYVSEGATDLFGVTPEEILSNPQALFASYSPEYRAQFRDRLIEASKTMSMWDVEASLRTPDGRTKYTHAIARPTRQDDGSVLWTGVILDATRIKEAEKAAAEAEVMARSAIVESLPQGFLMFGPDDRLITFNMQFLTIFPFMKGIAQPGMLYEDMVRAELSRGGQLPETYPAFIAALRNRLDLHQRNDVVLEYDLGGERCIQVNEHRTSGSGIKTVLYTDVSELKHRERKIQHLALHDALTGLPNRVLFRDRIEEALIQNAKRGTNSAIFCIDLDHFKNINDTLGHPAGDRLLTVIGERLNMCIRESDTAARLGGDEFAVILTDVASPGFAEAFAWRLLNIIAQPIEYHDQHDPDTLLRNADLALYRAKNDGRNTFRFFEAEMDALAQKRRALEIDLREAVMNNELELHYQPLVDAETGEIVSFEALLRWLHPRLGQISPTDFIGLAEESGIILHLGEWVLRRACLDAAQWPSRISVAVNLSPAQFRNRDLAQSVAKILLETRLPASRLELEVTESLLLRDTEVNLNILKKLKELGVRISMDDFGTGYSSLGNLRSFPFDKIKIDRSFVAGLERQQDSAAIISAVLSLGRDLGMKTTAEGVENDEQLRLLQNLGCKEIQGFFYSRPVSPKQAVELIRIDPFKTRSGDMNHVDHAGQ
jgi:diguanylate cyclase (GGDEF)-like protein/PAS domain S-box-containing protein